MEDELVVLVLIFLEILLLINMDDVKEFNVFDEIF